MFYGWLFVTVIPDFLKVKEVHLKPMVAWQLWAILSIVAALVFPLRREISFAYKSFWEAPKLLVFFLGTASALVLLFYGYHFITSVYNLLETPLVTPYQTAWVGYGLLFISSLPSFSYYFLFEILNESSKILLGEWVR